MTEIELFSRIQVNPQIFGGKPIIRGLRIAVEQTLEVLAAGETPERVLQEYPFLEPEDIQACLVFAYRSMSGEQVHELIFVHRLLHPSSIVRFVEMRVDEQVAAVQELLDHDLAEMQRGALTVMTRGCMRIRH